MLRKHSFSYLSSYYSQFFPLLGTNFLLTDFSDLLSPQPQQALLSADDLQRIESVSLFYQNRIEFGEEVLF